MEAWRPWRSNLTLNFNALTSIIYVPTLLVTIHKIIATAVYLKWPLRLLTASEVTSDLHFELSGLNNPHGAHQGQKGDRFGILESFPPRREGGKEKV